MLFRSPITDQFVFPKVDVTIGLPFVTKSAPYEASAVPTGLSLNPTSNSLHIGEFTGFPFEQGSATVFSRSAAPSAIPMKEWTGFSLITDVAAGADGSLFVLEYASNFFKSAGGGSIWRVAPGGNRSQIISGLKIGRAHV